MGGRYARRTLASFPRVSFLARILTSPRLIDRLLLWERVAALARIFFRDDMIVPLAPREPREMQDLNERKHWLIHELLDR